MQQIYTPQQNYKVFVRTITYNQAKYITDTLDGVAMQQTNFPFVHYVIDDCSTDGEQKVIKSWINDNCDMDKADNIDLELASVILVPHKSNQSLTFAFYLLKRNLWKEPKQKDSLIAPWRDHCEYEALCEGDDYWIDPQKLQKQVDFLDCHPDYGLVYGQAEILSGDTKDEKKVWGEDGDLKKLAFSTSFIPTLSACYRLDLYNKYLQVKSDTQRWPLGDVPLWMFFYSYSKVKFLPGVIGVYRQLAESASHSRDFSKRINFINGAFNCRAYYVSKYLGKEFEKKVITTKINNLLWQSIENDKPLNLNLLSEMMSYRIFNVKLFGMLLVSKIDVLRHLAHKRLIK